MFNVQNSGTLVINALHFLIHVSWLLNLSGALLTDPFVPFPYCPVPLLLALRLLTPLLDHFTIPWTVLPLIVSVSKAIPNCQPSLSWFRVL